jgi:hypothetical protein
MNIADRVLGTRRVWPPNRDDKEALRVWLQRRFDGIDLQVLDDDEIRKLLELRKKTATEGGGTNMTLLDRSDTKAFEKLVERACSRPNMFSETREREQTNAQIAALAARARRPAPRPRFEEQGAVVLSREWIFDWLNRPDPILEIEHLGFLVFVLGQLENGVALTPGGAIEGGGDYAALIVNHNLGFGVRFDSEQRLGRWRDALDHLDRNKLLEVERRGGELVVRRGRRVLEALKRRAAA